MRERFEWPTLLLLAVVYGLWGVATTILAQVSLWLAVPLLATVIAQHASLTHEMVHGHPFQNKWLNALLVFPAVALLVPYLRFLDTHLAHHQDSNLTDPYDDPESNYSDPAVWDRLPGWCRAVLRFNNTLLGRLTVGPVVGQIAFMRADWALVCAGDRRVLLGWVLHVPALIPIVWWLNHVAVLPVWAYLVAAYFAHALLKIRTFLEHQAHERASGRTVIIEDKGPLALLFLNNNFHVVHHMHPKEPWYRLPAVYFARPETYLSRNGGYMYRSYGDVFRRYFLRAKDPVPHPLWSRD